MLVVTPRLTEVPSAAGKHTTVNPKFDILQQGYDPVNKVSHVQTMEPLLLSWRTTTPCRRGPTGST